MLSATFSFIAKNSNSFQLSRLESKKKDQERKKTFNSLSTHSIRFWFCSEIPGTVLLTIIVLRDWSIARLTKK